MICNNVILVTVILTQTMPHQTKTPSWPMTRDTSRCPKKLRAYLWCTSPVDGRLQAAKKALCEVPPVRLQCTGGRSPKCILVLQICGSCRVFLGRGRGRKVLWQKVGPKVCIFLVRFYQWRGNEVQVSRDIESAKWRLDDQLFSEW